MHTQSAGEVTGYRMASMCLPGSKRNHFAK
jgi:hypothetical protein